MVLACQPSSEGEVRTPDLTADAPADSDVTDAALDSDTDRVVDSDGGDTDGKADTDPNNPCPPHMALISGGTTFCIDRYEAYLDGHSPYEVPEAGGVARSRPGQVPQGYISGTVAADACANASKRLCSYTEWMRACQGSAGTVYPYGNTYDANACNDTRGSHPINDLWGDNPNRWDSDHMNDPGLNQLPDSLYPTGAYPQCVSEDGVFDLHGNLHEWISDPAGTFKGGFYVDALINGPGCTYATTAHSMGHHDYSTGFRCCSDL